MIPGIILYLEDLKQFDGILTDADLGAVIRALMAYVETGEEVQNLSPVCELALRILKAKVDRDTKKYSAQLENGKKGGRPKNPNKPNETQINPNEPNETQANPIEPNTNPKNQTETETETKTETEKETETEERVKRDTRTKEPFSPPTQDQIREYIARHHLSVDPVAFWSYYKARDWMMGKARMQDWEAALESWQTREGSKATGKPNLRVLSAYCEGQRDLTEDDMRGTTEEDILTAIMEQRKKVNG